MFNNSEPRTVVAASSTMPVVEAVELADASGRLKFGQPSTPIPQEAIDPYAHPGGRRNSSYTAAVAASLPNSADTKYLSADKANSSITEVSSFEAPTTLSVARVLAPQV